MRRWIIIACVLNVAAAVFLFLYHAVMFGNAYSSAVVEFSQFIPGADAGSEAYEKMRAGALRAISRGSTGVLPLVSVVLCNAAFLASVALKLPRTASPDAR